MSIIDRLVNFTFPGPVRLYEEAISSEYKPILTDDTYSSVDETTPILTHDKITIYSSDTSKAIARTRIAPADASKYIDMYSAYNAGIFSSYFAIGVVSRLNQTPVQYYLIGHLHASSAQYSAYTTLHRLPWSMKLIFGMLSDGIPLLGYRRKSWLSMGWLGYSFISFLLSCLGSPSINTTVFMVFFFTCFLVQADVCTDTLCVERSKLEKESNKGNLQTIGFIYRAFGRIIGAILGTYLYDNDTRWSYNISQIFLLQTILPALTMLFFFWNLIELSTSIKIPSLSEQISEIWRVLQLEAVWKPVIFIYSFNIMQINNPVWSNFLVYGLQFNDAKLGYLLIFSAIVSFVGYLSYKIFFFQSNLKAIYVYTSLLGLLFSFLQIVLILRWNVAWGLSDEIFALGDEGTIALAESLNAMPFYIMFMILCPDGAEGGTFALMTTISSLSGTVSYDIGTKIAKIWDVSNSALQAGDYSGVLKITILISILKYTPLLLIGLLPDTRESYQKWIDEGKSSFVGGLCLAIVVTLSFLYTVYLTLEVLVM